MRSSIRRTDARAPAQSAGRGLLGGCPSHARAQRGGDDIGAADPRFSAAPQAKWFTRGGQQKEAQRLWQQYLQVRVRGGLRGADGRRIWGGGEGSTGVPRL
jgi:hypothetical protein